MIHNATHQSTMITSSSYDTETRELMVTFTGGINYLYENVTNEDYTSFIDADSSGKGFNEFIRKYGGLISLNEIEGDDLKTEDGDNMILG